MIFTGAAAVAAASAPALSSLSLELGDHLELAGRAAAVARGEVPVVAGLGRVDEAVAADLHAIAGGGAARAAVALFAALERAVAAEGEGGEPRACTPG